MEKQLVVVVVPIYQEEPAALEKVSLTQTLKILNKYPITFMTPYGLNITWYENFCRGKAQVFFERFSWKGYEQFSMLQSSALFYERFLKYQYLLICHLDAFVFRDELEEWCALGYDYIGSVIYNPVFKFKNTPLRKLSGFTAPEYFGNGGFGLKKVESYYHITSRFSLYISAYHRIRKWRKNPFFDDLFFTQHFPKLSSGFTIAPLAEASRFGAAYEVWEEIELPFDSNAPGTLPFGIHGWIQHHQDYWLPCIRKLGYDV